MSLSLVSLLLVAAIGCATADEPEKLVGASNANMGEFPYAVSLRQGNSHFCGGAIISPTHILTAAHCLVQFHGRSLNGVTVVSGSNFLSRGGQSHRVVAVYTHPQYGGGAGHNWVNDVGVMKLAAPITFNNVQRAIPLATSTPPAGAQAIVSAWGNTAAPPRGGLSDALQKLFLRIVSLQECAQHHGSVVQNYMICTLNQVNVGTCNGDSGSPLVYNGQVVGVVSGGIPCARGVPDIFTNIATTGAFVRQAMSY